MHDNAPCHAAKATIKCLEGLGFKDETLMVWPPNSPDINPIENLWAIIKQRVYADGKQFSTLHELWKAIKLESAAIPHSLVKKLNDSVNDRLLDVIRCQGGTSINDSLLLCLSCRFQNFRVFFRSVRYTINHFVHFLYHKHILSPCKLIAWFRRK